MKKSLLLISTVLCALGRAQGHVTLPPLISDNMLLQSPEAVVWGRADPDEIVTVKLDRAVATATTGKDGRWRVRLFGLNPGVPGEMTVSGKNKLTIQNVAVGDVWVCSGQSNMEMTVAKGDWPGGLRAVKADKEVAAGNYPDIRMFIVLRQASETPVEEVQGKWEVCSPETVSHWSATAYYFGRQLNKDLGIPIGLLHSSWGGTYVQAWMATATLQGDPEFKKDYYIPRQTALANYPAWKEKYDKVILPKWEADVAATQANGGPRPPKPREPIGPGGVPALSVLYNGMIHGLTTFAIKGAIWYQGEDNVFQATAYRRLLPAMIASWRKAWNEPDFPFFIVQLPNFMAATPEPADSYWADLREAQRLTALNTPHTGLAVAIDIGDAKNIHPLNKQEVGRRLALEAEAKTYGKDVISSGPAFEHASFDGANVRITFKPGTALGLATKDTGSVNGFAVAGEDRKFAWAEAKIVPAPTPSKEQMLVLSAPGIVKPVSVRYAWANNPEVNLVNQAGLPAVPFRTDDWPQNPPKFTPSPTPKP